MADETITTAESNDTFECAVPSSAQLSHDFHDWPENIRKASDAAIERLLADHPRSKVIGDTSQCIDDTHPRYPDNWPKGQFFGVRTIKLDQPLEVEPSAGPYSAAIHIRQFEDANLGPAAVRINGLIERGSGSPFAALSPEKKAEYAALEKLVVTEQKLADAHAALIQADADHEAALAALEPKSDAAAE